MAANCSLSLLWLPSLHAWLPPQVEQKVLGLTVLLFSADLPGWLWLCGLPPVQPWRQALLLLVCVPSASPPPRVAPSTPALKGNLQHKRGLALLLPPVPQNWPCPAQAPGSSLEKECTWPSAGAGGQVPGDLPPAPQRAQSHVPSRARHRIAETEQEQLPRWLPNV